MVSDLLLTTSSASWANFLTSPLASLSERADIGMTPVSADPGRMAVSWARRHGPVPLAACMIGAACLGPGDGAPEHPPWGLCAGIFDRGPCGAGPRSGGYAPVDSCSVSKVALLLVPPSGDRRPEGHQWPLVACS